MGIVVIHWVLTCWQQRLPLFSFPPQKPNAVPVPQASCWVPKIKSIYKALLLSTYHCLVYRLVFSPTKNKKNPHTSVIVPLGFAAVLHTQILSPQWWFFKRSGTTEAQRKDSPSVALLLCMQARFLVLATIFAMLELTE